MSCESLLGRGGDRDPSGIGAAVAHSLASALARVALAARRQYELLAVQAGLDGQGDEVRGLSRRHRCHGKGASRIAGGIPRGSLFLQVCK